MIAQNAPGTIAVMTVNWNRPALTLSCLDALRRTQGASWHLIIVDNASSDDSVKRLSNLGDDVTLIQAEVNGGWSGGSNRAVRAAMAANFDHLFFLNNDAIVEPTTLSMLLATARAIGEPIPVIGAVQHDEAGGEGAWYGSYERTDAPYPVDLGVADYAGLPDVYGTGFIKGAALFAHRRHFETIGFFDDRFFLNFEETDWCARAKNAGFPLIMTKTARVFHSGSGTMGGLSSPISTYFLVRNALLYSEKRGGLRNRARGLKQRASWIKHQYRTASWTRAVACLARDRSPWAVAFRRGFVDYLLRRFGDCPDVIRQITYRATSLGRS
jgi:hypothetical protein